jgi:uncharacterized protein
MGTNVQVIRDLYDAFAKGDLPGVLGALDPSVQWIEAESFPYADRSPYSGPGAVAEGVFQRFLTALNDVAVVPERIFDAGETVITEGRYRGVVKATGTRVDAQFAHVWSLRDGKVVEFRQYTDTKQWGDAGL